MTGVQTCALPIFERNTDEAVVQVDVEMAIVGPHLVAGVVGRIARGERSGGQKWLTGAWLLSSRFLAPLPIT